MPYANGNRLISGEMVTFTAGVEQNKAQFYIHQNLLNSVTDAFARKSPCVKSGFEEDLRHFEFLTKDAETFKMFLSWLYNNDRTQEMKTQCYRTNSLLRLYDLGIALQCDALQSDILCALLVVIQSDANDFIETVDSIYQRCLENHEDFFRLLFSLHTMLNEISEIITIELPNIDSFLKLYVDTVSWGNEKWQNRVMDNIQDKLYAQKEALDFDQIAFVFEGTKDTSPSDDKLRKFCAAMVYYQRNWGEDRINPDNRLKAEVMERLLRDIDGFMTEYLKFEDDYQTKFRGELPKDPRSRNGELGTCYFHFHELSEACAGGMDLDA
jgi:hypothetical protein